jgi:hypothetical protein
LTLLTSAADAQTLGPLPPPITDIVINVQAYGAVCDGRDDSAAINSAISAARSLLNASPATGITIQFPSDKLCMIRSTLNFTGHHSLVSPTAFGNSFLGLHVKNGNIDCQVTGGPCIDALGAMSLTFTDMNIVGNATNRPTIGMQFGVTISGTTAGANSLRRVKLYGSFSFTGIYNFGSEVFNYDNVQIMNFADGYAVVLDGSNRWNINSAFEPEGIPANTPTTMMDQMFVTGSYQTQSTTKSAFWVSGTGRLRAHAIYSSTGAPCNVTYYIFQADYFGNNENIWDAHFEPTSATDAFCFDGSVAAPILKGFRYSTEAASQVSNSILKILGTSSITSMEVDDIDLSVVLSPQTQGAPSKIFANPTQWTVSGRVYVSNAAQWVEPYSFSGSICITTSCTSYVPTEPLNQNADLLVSQPAYNNLVSTSSLVFTPIDGWLWSAAGGTGNRVSYQRVAATGIPYIFSEQASHALGGNTTPTAGQLSGLVTRMGEGEDFASAQFGTASAKPIQVEWWAQANNTGIYAFRCGNQSSNRSYVINFTIAQANTWQRFRYTIPGDITGTWTSGEGNTPLNCGFVFQSGTTFQTSANVWTAGNFYSTGSEFAFTNTTGSTFNWAGLRGYIGALMPYKQRSRPDAILLAQRYYAKSFLHQQPPVQNVGNQTGAVTITLPYAQATFGSIGTAVRFPRDFFRSGGTIAPTMTFYSTNAATANCYNVTKARDSGAAAASNISNAGFTLTCTLVAGDAIGDTLAVHWTADLQSF